jgi:hypothetical protein
MSKSSSNGTKDAKTVPAPWGEDDFIAALARLETMHNEASLLLQKKAEDRFRI